MSIFGNEELDEMEPTVRVVKNSLGIDLGTLNTVIAKPSGDKLIYTKFHLLFLLKKMILLQY